MSDPTTLNKLLRPVAMLCWSIVVILFLLPTETNSQQPDPNGWSSGGSQATVSQDLSQPNRLSAPLSPQFPPPSSQSVSRDPQVPNEVRVQIGLATYNQPSYDQPNFDQPTNPDNRQLANEQPLDLNSLLSNQTESLTAPDGIQSSIKIALLLATLSLAPAVILMTTCYIRVIVVLSLLRQAFGGQQLPPTQVLTALSLFLTFLIMTPVWTEIKTDAIDPYTRAENAISWDEALERGVVPVKSFMARQIEQADNGESIAIFYKYLPELADQPPTSIESVPLKVLLPAFMISELKVAFLLGFQIFLPFLVIDLVVSSVTVSMGMLMLPPNMVSFPLKLILFVMVDGWNLVVGMLLQSFASYI